LVEGDKYDIAYGAQDLSPNESGAYTGDVSGSMLAKLGCSYVTVGHSERRQIHQESDEIVNAKARTALRYEITPIICVGEGREVREARGHVAYVLAQLAACLEGLTAEQVAGAVIAYEPVWAIGTGMVATPDDAQEVCAAIRTRVGELLGAGTARAVRVLYGGSVKANNIAGIMAQPDIDGALVGGASLDPDEFVGIVRFRLHPAETGG
jgi:triosephosphate isomerase